MGTLKTGRLVEAIMKYRGMKVDDLAKAMSWHPMNVYKLLNGKKRITDELAIKIAKIAEEKAMLYDKALERAKLAIKDCGDNKGRISMIESIFPELGESENEKIKIEIIRILKGELSYTSKEDADKYIAWLEKQGEQKSSMIQWKGNNLKEIINFTGKCDSFDKWFSSFEEYEKYVHEHNNIFKLFNEDGSHYEVPVGAWIVKTPDGRNVSSKAVFVNKSTKWSEEDKGILLSIKCVIDNVWHSTSDIDTGYSNEELKEMWEWLDEIWERVEYPAHEEKWDKKDEQKPAEKQEHPINYKEAEKACLEYRKMREECGIKDPVMLDEIEEAYYNGATSIQKPVWSDEDEENLQHCCGAIAAADYYTVEDKQDMIDWLKSLKE